MPIRQLPEEVASQIAAGEVIERPASVVKELLENALDAGASQVTIQIEAAGRNLVEVADNGVGIPAGDLPLAVARHATSKLATAEDLFRIRTLGFRGEALASIGSVSRLTLSSVEAGAVAGARLRVEGGRIAPVEPFGGPVGTVVRVEDLFYNVPARLKFLNKIIPNGSRLKRWSRAMRWHIHPSACVSRQTEGKACKPTAAETAGKSWPGCMAWRSPDRCWKYSPMRMTCG